MQTLWVLHWPGLARLWLRHKIPNTNPMGIDMSRPCPLVTYSKPHTHRVWPWIHLCVSYLTVFPFKHKGETAQRDTPGWSWALTIKLCTLVYDPDRVCSDHTRQRPWHNLSQANPMGTVMSGPCPLMACPSPHTHRVWTWIHLFVFYLSALPLESLEETAQRDTLGWS